MREVRLFLALAVLAACGAGAAIAQEIEPPPAAKGGVRITFLPPPMEGTLSLGVYDKAGKLVRVLAREATEKEFTIGLNGLITSWDGRDDSGKVQTPGLYGVRGYCIGAIHVEGVAYHGNDWVADEQSPRLRKVIAVELPEGGRLTVWGETADQKTVSQQVGRPGEFAGAIPLDPSLPASGASRSAAPPPPLSRRATVKDGKVNLSEGEGARVLSLPELSKATDASLGADGVWVIDQGAERTEVKEYGLDGGFKRRLAIDPSEPTPRRIFASITTDLIFLIEEGPGVQRVRGLALQKPANVSGEETSGTSTWKTVLSKSILASDQFQMVAGNLGRVLPFIPRDKFTVHLLPNPLLQDALTTASITIDFNGGGSFLRTLDGLPLRRITAAPHLRWAVIGQEGSGKLLTIFQSDGAVVEEFKAHKLANMMAFDAGEYELKAEK